MTKSRKHTTQNWSQTWHRNGIKKPKKSVHEKDTWFAKKYKKSLQNNLAPSAKAMHARASAIRILIDPNEEPQRPETHFQ
jgi:hypothetical protein